MERHKEVKYGFNDVLLDELFDVPHDYESKKRDLEAIEISLNKNVDSLNVNIEKQTKKFESLVKWTRKV